MLAGFTLLTVCILLMASIVLAADVTLKPQLSVGAAYDDNIFLTENDKLDSTIFTVSPRLELNYETLLSDYTLTADLDILSYQDESDLNRTNQYYYLEGENRLGERWETDFDLRFYRDTTLNSYLQETGRVIDRVQRDYVSAGGSLAYNLTRVSGISAGYRYQTASYENDRFSDWDRHSGSLYYYHRLKTEIDVLSLGPSYSHRNNDSNEVDSWALNAGWKRDWNNITHSDTTIGARHTKVTREDGTEDDTWGAKANFELTLDGIANRTRIIYFHDLRTTADGADINVDNFFVDYERSITERFRMGIEGRLVFSYKLLDQQSDINDSRLYWIEPNLSYQLTRYLGVSLRYRYQNNVESADDRDVTKERNIVWLQLSAWYPMKL
jgi:hypothetical protein